MSEVAIYKGPYLGDDRLYVRLDAYNDAVAENHALQQKLDAANAETEKANLLIDELREERNLLQRIAGERGNKLDALAAEAGYLRDAIKQHSQSTHFCEVCGKDDPCKNDDVCWSLNHELPATGDYLNSVRAEGIHFAANRMLAAWDSGFIDDTPAQAYDISGAVLSAVEFLPNASPEEFKRDFADSIRREIKASTASAGKDGE